MVRVQLLKLAIFAVINGVYGETRDIEDVDDGRWLDEIDTWRDYVEQPAMEINSAWLNIVNDANLSAVYYWQNSECEGCPLRPQETIDADDSKSFLVQASYVNHLAIEIDNIFYCKGEKLVRERGDYWLIVHTADDEVKCHLVLTNDPANEDIYVLYGVLILVGLAFGYVCLKSAYKRGVLARCRGRFRSEEFTVPDNALELNNSVSTIGEDVDSKSPTAESMAESETSSHKIHRKRLKSLDCFRGITIVLMVFVNYGGGGYWFFTHAAWNGLYITDLVFPWLVFMMGTSLSFMVRSVVERDTPPYKVLHTILLRSFKLFAVGFCLGSQSNNDVRTIRILGILQRLALSYLLTTLIHYPFTVIALRWEAKSSQKSYFRAFHDVTLYWGEWLVMLGVLAAHVCITFLLPVPGCPTGYIGPGGLHNGGMYYNCTAGAALYVDQKILSNTHLYQWPTPKTLYEGNQPYDPEGLLGTLSAAFQCFLGAQAGKIIYHYNSHGQRVGRWLLWALLTAGIGTLLCQARINGGWVPINKNLWSVSFSLVTSATAFVMLSVMYVLIDALEVWPGQPFIYAGRNSIGVYCLHSIFSGYIPVSWQMPDMTQHWQQLILAIWGCIFWLLVAFFLHTKKLFISL